MNVCSSKITTVILVHYVANLVNKLLRETWLSLKTKFLLVGDISTRAIADFPFELQENDITRETKQNLQPFDFKNDIRKSHNFSPTKQFRF